MSDPDHDVALHVEVLGTGTPIIVLHGWGHSGAVLKPMAEFLAQDHAVHLMDLPGFGKSDVPPCVWDTFRYAKRIRVYMEQEGIPSADFVGHSFGGKVALCMALEHPEKVKSLSLLAPSGFRSALPWRWRLRAACIRWAGKALKALDTLRGSRWYAEWFVPKFASNDYQKAGPMRAILVKTIYDDLTDKLHNIQCPTLLLWGDRDSQVPLQTAHHLHEHLKVSKLIVYPGKGHDLFYDVGAHLCAHHILQFLQSKTLASASHG